MCKHMQALRLYPLHLQPVLIKTRLSIGCPVQALYISESLKTLSEPIRLCCDLLRLLCTIYLLPSSDEPICMRKYVTSQGILPSRRLLVGLLGPGASDMESSHSKLLQTGIPKTCPSLMYIC